MASDEFEELERRLQITGEAVRKLSPRSEGYLSEARELWREVNCIRERLYKLNVQPKQSSAATRGVMN